MVTASDVYWDPYDEAIDTHPYEIWDRLRDESPLYGNDRYDFWALSRFSDVQEAHAELRSDITSMPCSTSSLVSG
jgi:hypothetical protein